MEFVVFRNLVGVSHTEDEVKALAEEVSVMSFTGMMPSTPAATRWRQLAAFAVVVFFSFKDVCFI